jgi:hypothetical protein
MPAEAHVTQPLLARALPQVIPLLRCISVSACVSRTRCCQAPLGMQAPMPALADDVCHQRAQQTTVSSGKHSASTRLLNRPGRILDSRAQPAASPTHRPRACPARHVSSDMARSLNRQPFLEPAASVSMCKPAPAAPRARRARGPPAAARRRAPPPRRHAAPAPAHVLPLGVCIADRLTCQPVAHGW